MYVCSKNFLESIATSIQKNGAKSARKNYGMYLERYYNHDDSIFDSLEATGYEADDAYSLFVADITEICINLVAPKVKAWYP